MSELAALLLAGDDVTESLRAIPDIVSRMLPGQPLVRVVVPGPGGTGVDESSGAEAVSVPGFRSICVLPLAVNNRQVGTLALYATRRAGISDETRHAATLTADYIGVLLDVARGAARRAKLTTQLRATLASRSTIDQALGIVMGQQRCTRAAAFDRLREISMRRNIKISALSAEIIEQVTGAKPVEPHFVEPG
ncbi:GAF and ANTAR domain-containing protein [Nocardia sp. NPDC127526]|uniref:GAF and ANTAR domain-containing protein n=1 Tax=Nocardia sp. NPDC127526 TaxID=3345393 RepID=UPI0036329D5B